MEITKWILMKTTLWYLWRGFKNEHYCLRSVASDAFLSSGSSCQHKVCFDDHGAKKHGIEIKWT